MSVKRQWVEQVERMAASRATGRRLLVLAGGLGLLVVLSGTAFAASSYESPVISSTRSTFTVPTPSTSVWTLQLWSGGALEGSDVATSGLLAVDVPHVTGCVFQADVDVTPLGGRRYFYSGSRATLRTCGVKRTTQTIAGHIYLCDASGTATATEVAGGTLAATGPQSVTTQANPLVPTAVTTGTYTMTASAPGGYVLVGCGGRATVGSGGTTATESVTSPPGGAGVGLFYVAATPVGAGGGSTGTNTATSGHPIGATSSSNSSTPPSAPVHAATAAAHHPPPLVPVTAAQGSALAFTGMDIGPPLLLGLLLIGLGTVMISSSGPRRSWTRQPVPVVPPKSSS